jgi:hypothetical protein
MTFVLICCVIEIVVLTVVFATTNQREPPRLERRTARQQLELERVMLRMRALRRVA